MRDKPPCHRGGTDAYTPRDLPLCPHPSRPNRGKKTYRSKAKAKQAAIVTWNRKLYPYLCRTCGLWHLTHHEQTKRAA